MGCTAVGKTALSLELAERHGCEILSLDSMLVYRGMDIGTAKPSVAERERVPHHLIDLVEPSERYDLRRYLTDFEAAEAEVRARGRIPLVVGGTGLYLQAVLEGLFEGPAPDLELRARLEGRFAEEGGEVLHGELARLDPPSADRIHPNDRKRLVRALEVVLQTGRALSEWQREWTSFGAQKGSRPRRIVGLTLEPQLLEERIRTRTRAMLDAGWAEEAERVRRNGGFGPTAMQALGYREVLRMVDGEASRGETEERIALATRRFARRQRTWLRRFEDLKRVDPGDADAAEVVGRFLFG